MNHAGVHAMQMKTPFYLNFTNCHIGAKKCLKLDSYHIEYWMLYSHALKVAIDKQWKPLATWF